MPLNDYVAKIKREIFEDLIANQPPRTGRFDAALLSEVRAKGKPQMGTTRYEPSLITIEFIFNDPTSSNHVFTVELDAPERIVFLPVPSWVVETIWQGEIDGTYHFESDANRMIADFQAQTAPAANAAFFGPRAATRRE